ncbi:hypothetical protein OIU79_019763 [Salix purpurea]|uniref:Uncharacterized protein n=1 Tax=Salix purpurea TaxID=77065 RepID=A0A9Q0P1Z5_SALPP|nr:hypothetical protein OIU79_019763 [Salix purpurea]
MILSRLAATATRSYRSLSLAYNIARIRGSATDPTGRPRDPEVCAGREYETQHAVPTGKPEEMAGKYEPEAAKRQMEEEYRLGKETEPLAPTKPPHAPITRLENAGVHNPAEPIVQQRRKNSTLTLEEISCAGLDGTPWPEDERSRREQVEDENEYSSHRKASPLSEIQVADTRKPITRATDGTACAEIYNEPGDVIGWLPEQLDTAEQALERARRIWKENAMRGDPDSPHGRVLRELRGEWF